jgi:hypothetical protein
MIHLLRLVALTLGISILVAILWIARVVLLPAEPDRASTDQLESRQRDIAGYIAQREALCREIRAGRLTIEEAAGQLILPSWIREQDARKLLEEHSGIKKG